MTWDQPHWSGRQPEGAGPRQKLRPNGFARLARFSAARAVLVVAFFLILAAVAGIYAASVLRVDPDQRPRVTLDAATEQRQAELERQFPGIENTFLAVVESRDPETARAQAVALASSLSARADLFLSAFVPGTGEFYETYALMFRSLEDVRARVDGLLQMEPLHYAMASAPDVLGFASLVNEIGKAVEQGRSPPGLEAMLLAASAAIEGEVRGSPRPIRWEALAGLDGEVQSQRWYVLATPKPGMEREAAAMARQASDGMQDTGWVWPRRALASAPSTLRDFVVPASLSVFLTLIITAALLGSLRQTVALTLGGIVTLATAAATAAALGKALDGATWSFALAVLAPVHVAGAAVCIGFARGRVLGLAPVQAVMLACHRRGGYITASILVFAALWLAWLPRRLPSLSEFAIIALIGCAMAWLVAMTFIPAVLALLAPRHAPEEPNWLDEAMEEGVSPHARNAMDALAMVVLAAAIFCAAFLPGVRFGERQWTSWPLPLLETPDARGAVHILVPEAQVADLVARLSSLPEVGAIRTPAQFLPPEAQAKVAELRRLASLTPLEPAFRDQPEEALLGQSFADLQQQLAAIAESPAASPALKDAALRLRRAAELYAGAEPVTAQRAAALDRALFGGLAQLSATAQRLAAIEAPGVKDLDPRLLARFVSPQGLWRVEVMPRGGTGELSFAAALRRTVPEATGEPLVSLARNEIIHHETVVALGTALAAVALILLIALRNAAAWAFTLVPAAAFITLTAAVTASLGISLNAAMLAGLSAAAAVVVASAMIMAIQATGGREAGPLAPALRAALLPPLALAGAVGPLALSSRPAVAELGTGLAMLLAAAALLGILLVPAMARWVKGLMRRAPKRQRRS